MVLGAAVLILAAAGSTGAAITPGTVGGTVTITGTDGKDEFVVHVDQSGNGFVLVVEPAATVTSTLGPCPPLVDPLSGRPTVNRCPLDLEQALTLVVNLKAGDDSVRVQPRAGTDVGVGAGAGNDLVEILGGGSRSLKGEDGNDTLLTAGDLSVTQANKPVTYDGGAGIDTAAWVAPRVSTADDPLGVSASLASATATFSGVNIDNQPTTFRTDSLKEIESLSGTDFGDVLVGNTGPNVLSGGAGNDTLRGSDGADQLFGGIALDSLDGGKDSDTMDGGPGIDDYPAGGGLDTYNTRDGYLESVTCVKNDVIVDDLVDKVINNTTTNACSVSTAAAKHLYDTHLSGRPARVVADTLATKVRCPAEKPEPCEGRLAALLGKRELGHADYKLRPGRAGILHLPISDADARRASGKRIVLSAEELDADGRDRFVSRPTRVEKVRPD
jgi:Ca2+-binding RTX toxin-like protein